MHRRSLPLWLKLFFFAAFVLLPTVATLVASLRNSTSYLANLSINSEVEEALKSNLDAMRELKQHTPPESLDMLERRFKQHLETYQAYSALKDVKTSLLDEFYHHALIVGILSLLTSLIVAGFLARNILKIFNDFASKLRDRERQQAMLSSLENWQEVSKSVIHELKSSLMPIKLLASRYAVSEVHENDKVQMIITTEVVKMESLIDELTGFARLPKPKLSDTNLVQTLEYIRQNFLIDNLSINLKLHALGLLQKRIPHDSGMIHRLFFNLMKNAREANPDKVAVTITDALAGGMVQLHIQDDGIGINPSKLSAIFESGVSEKPRATQSHDLSQLPSNLGIGLAICKKIALDHGGDLIAQRSDQGAHFILTLPLSNDLKDPE